jgi:predicted house-cleaning NTP pyrophosphatase (Maf/HAM1 superfamily)
VQGEGGKFVQQVRGSYSNVVGLPMEAVTELLRCPGPTVPHRAPVRA